MNRRTRRDFLRNTVAVAGGLAIAGEMEPDNAVLAKETAGRDDLFNRFFIMDTWFWTNNWDIQKQVEILKQLGIPRTCHSLKGDEASWKAFPAILKTLDQGGIELISVYSTLEIDAGVLPQNLKELIQRLQGRKTLLWLSLTSKKYKSSDPAGEEPANRLLLQAAEEAQKTGLRISIYPHFSFWAERTDDVFRAAQKTQRDNVGCTFNLYHWLKVEGPDNLENKAKTVLPRLNCVTVNGSRKNAKELKVEEGILPLGEGDYDVKAFVKTFTQLGYAGPIGLQGYSIGGDIRAKLEKSLQEWKTYAD